MKSLNNLSKVLPLAYTGIQHLVDGTAKMLQII